MNALRLMCYFALLMVLIPWRAQAADADDFVAANRSQQAQLLEQWAGLDACGNQPASIQRAWLIVLFYAKAVALDRVIKRKGGDGAQAVVEDLPTADFDDLQREIGP